MEHDISTYFKSLLLSAVGLLLTAELIAFCGFYVAKADAKLFNQSSQVILARDGNRTVVTMYSDYQGPIEDFAMVVPVPVLLKEKDIRVVPASIFDRLDTYSGPRLVEYYDQNPCEMAMYDKMSMRSGNAMAEMAPPELMMVEDEEDLGVTIEAQYEIEEYDVLILSARESAGLKTWLTENGYQIPEKAEEVLDPYIKSDMRFFVVKVNIEKFDRQEQTNIRPLQISYESSNFMLPIRLGMANAESYQDLIVYAFTKRGRIEATNYRTLKVPTDNNIPTFVADRFGEFYKDLFKRTWSKNKNAVYMEYAWDLSSSNFVKCDPCATTPPTLAELQDAGVFWVDGNPNNRGWGGADYSGDVFITRLHVRYDRQNFPQDLLFQETPDRASFQGRYVMTHPASGSFDCAEGTRYLKNLVDRREKELHELAALTGSDISQYAYYVEQYRKLLPKELEYKPVDDEGDRGAIDTPTTWPEPIDRESSASITIPPADNGEHWDTAELTYQPVGADAAIPESTPTRNAQFWSPLLLLAGLIGLGFWYGKKALKGNA